MDGSRSAATHFASVRISCPVAFFFAPHLPFTTRSPSTAPMPTLMAADLEMITDAIKHDIGFDALNSAIKDQLRSWLVNTAKQEEQDMVYIARFCQDRVLEVCC
jgi:hypothetical protein